MISSSPRAYAIPRFGSSLRAVQQYFVSEQDEMHGLVRHTALKSLEVNADGDFAAITDAAYRFWLE